ncbi:CDP-alcohol phosphatidyltransferase family protein [Sansalvadorimonas verongulae]|uniref:CDP-alcohol phosphatidyltransferase family protein n=1 Tax=Sansalvadorimonas verongulae TaxID=2172824 RepID=UPI0012BC8A30|nr:CDP-alcohol phosphatidyltransferase family protein [Sansalvadorimonas verongulae]MTI14570.1 CDP-alcohol phosphatidyltransferase family protein [Sansalvadorimonas verongulae]
MIDRWTHAWVQAPLNLLAKSLVGKVTPDQLTLAGFLIGLLSVPLLAMEWYIPALIAIMSNRVLDGLDGTLARYTQPTDAGGFLDICLDFIFYAAVILGFALANPAQNALAAAFLLFCFMGTGSSFLAFAIMAEKHQIERIQFDSKSLYYLGGIAEGTETLLFYVAICLWPQQFSTLAFIFGALCLITTLTRVYGGYRTLSRLPGQSESPS